MIDFDYIIIGGGCAGLSLAYELQINNKIENKTLAIIEPREIYERDKTWSFWKVNPHNFEDCVIKSWKEFSINISSKTNYINCSKTPYQTIDSGLFYKKIIAELELSAAVGTLNPKHLGLSYTHDDFNSLPRPKNILDSK